MEAFLVLAFPKNQIYLIKPKKINKKEVKME
jgi:hypothetical protein